MALIDAADPPGVHRQRRWCFYDWTTLAFSGRTSFSGHIASPRDALRSPGTLLHQATHMARRTPLRRYESAHTGGMVNVERGGRRE